MYWIWANERSNEYEVRIEGVPPFIEANHLNFDRGVAVTEDLPVIEISFTMLPDEAMTDNVIAPGCRGLLVSERLKSVLESLNIANMQYFAAKLINQDTGDRFDRYYIANVVGKADCIDYQRSELETDESGEIEYIDKLVFKEVAGQDFGDIFRLSGFHPVVVASDRVRDAVKQNRITGVRFYEPEGYSL